MSGLALLRGLIRLARFRADGLTAFRGTPSAYLNSLTPLLGFALVGAVLTALHGEGREALSNLLSTAIVLLAPAVVSEPLARRWGRDETWLKFMVALNWCQWTVPVVFIAAVVVASFLTTGGLSEDQAALGEALVVAAYGLSLQWFLARRALEVKRGQAVLLVLAMNLAAGVLALGPRLLAGHGLEG